MRPKAVRLGTLVFRYPLWVAEYEQPSDFIAEAYTSAAGSHVVYVQKIATPYITLESKDTGWMTRSDADAVRAMRNDIGGVFELEYDDGTVENVRFCHEKQLVIEPLFLASDPYYSATIPLAKA